MTVKEKEQFEKWEINFLGVYFTNHEALWAFVLVLGLVGFQGFFYDYYFFYPMIFSRDLFIFPKIPFFPNKDK